jgi:hypothetical protein
MNPIQFLQRLFPGVHVAVWYLLALILVYLVVLFIYSRIRRKIMNPASPPSKPLQEEFAFLKLGEQEIIKLLTRYSRSHNSCQEDMAAFIDQLVQANGAVERQRAVGAYPNVFWHIMTCDECYETFTVTLGIMDQEREAASFTAMRAMVRIAMSADRNSSRN